ncbi:MAG: hypothetical protein H5T91_00170 [Synergistetes bacterium]|nr:hypothetical protein [Synergistota bacterium]
MFKVIFEPIPDFKKEFDYIEKGVLHLYYVSPRSLRRALDRGYKPVAKIKNQKDRYFLLTRGELPPEGEILIALPFLEAGGYALLGIDIERVKLAFVKDYNDATPFHLDKIKRGG